MPYIAIISGTVSLKKHLKKTAFLEKGRKRYLLSGEAGDEAIGLLDRHGFSPIVQPEISEDFKTRFLREYVDLIGTLGEEYSNRLWWATDISSKNRFTSRLPLFLYQFITAVGAAKLKDYDCLIIFNPPWVIISSLTAMLREHKLKFVLHGNAHEKIISVGIGWLTGILAIFYRMLKTAYHLYYAKIKLSRKLRERIGHDCAYYVIKTFIYNHSFSEAGNYRDAFFGSLPDFLKEKNKSVLVYAVIAGNYMHCIESIKKCQSQLIMPLELLLSLSDILLAAYQVLFHTIKIKKEVFFFGYDVKDVIKNELLQTFNGIRFYQFLHYWSAKKLFSMLSVETFLMTCENNPWEKMCILAAREYSPDTTIIGYQHTVVPQSAANMFSSSKDKELVPSPDKILTVGESPKKIMERYGNYEKGTIEPACGLRFEYLFNLPLNERRRTNTILVALEGVFEVYKMANYAYNQLKDSPYTVIIRTHPVLPIKKLRRKLVKEFGSSPNVQISKQKSLKQDIESADMVIYWGSTVGLEALSMGKPVVHFQTGSVLSYDPLFECKHLKWVVSESDSLQKTVEAIYSLPDGDFYDQQKNAKSYLRTYFHPVTEERLQKFLS